MENTANLYNNYNALTSEILENSKRLAEICGNVGMTEQQEALKAGRKKMKHHKFSVGIMGEFKRGKSTVINAILGREIMPADVTPCSATMNRVSYGLTPYVELNMVDGSTQKIEVEELADYVTKLDDECSERSAKVNEAVVYYPCQFCQNGVDIIDTPGLNDDERMNKITEEIVPKLDAVIMVLIHDNPFSISEAEFVRNKLMCSDVGRLIFLVNKIDTIRREKDRIKAVESIKEKIKETVLKRTKDVHGEDSDEYRAVQSKLQDIAIFPISAINALDGRLENDADLLESSGMLEFENALSRMLTEERGLLEITPQLTRLIAVGKETAETIAVMQGSLETNAETFKETQNNVLNEITQLKENKENQTKLLRAKAEEVKKSLSQKAEQCYVQMQKETDAIISQTTVNRTKKLDDKQKQQLFEQKITEVEKKIDDVLAIHAERLTTELNAVLEEAATDIAANVITAGTVNINKHFDRIASGKKGSNKANVTMDALAITLETFTTYFGVVGVGGLIRGYKAAGIKGAAVGGVAGAAITFGAVMGLAALTGPIGLPLVVLTSVAGTYGGGKISELIFSKDMLKKQIEEIKTLLREESSKAITTMRVNKELEKWIQKEVTEKFDSLIKDMDTECGQIISEAERKIKEIEKNLSASETERQNERTRLENLNQEVKVLLEDMTNIYKNLTVPGAEREAVHV